jgi:hypothetical protein
VLINATTAMWSASGQCPLGDIAPATDLGQTLAAIVMIIGYGIIAVPTGIVTVELARESTHP